ncbi:diadenylate cyclase [Sorangium sp. So ce1389]|uniref:diadenylate cyclase n=1 Tax=Sorangium sp. So ce1389 TaxID=3133336 RepID=UPI003F5DEEC9
MADPTQNHWKFFSVLLQKAAQDATAGFPHELSPKARLIFLPLQEGMEVVTLPRDRPLDVSPDAVLERVREVATNRDLRMRTLAIQSAATAAVVRAVDPATSFCGDGRIHGDHVVVPVLEVSPEPYSRCPALELNVIGNISVPRGLADTVMEVVVEEATSELSKPQPGGDIHDCMKLEPGAVIQRAARRLLGRVAVSISAPQLMGQLYNELSTIASLRYESQVNRGSLILAKMGHPSVRRIVTFKERAPLNKPNWARKIVQLALPSASILCDELGLSGIGQVVDYDPTREDLFEVVFVGHHRWHLRHGNTVLLDVHYGQPALPRPRLAKDAFVSTLQHVFGAAGTDTERLWSLASAAVESAHHGALLVVSEKAEDEATRLKRQSTPIEPILGDAQIVEAFSAVDGAILMDPAGKVFAFGVILDGVATDRGTPARGARFNSSFRYVDSADHKVLALVISEDGQVDPIFRCQ